MVTATDCGLVKPANGVLVAGKPIRIELTVETSANVIPGRLVKLGSNQGKVVVNTAGAEPLAWVGYESSGIGTGAPIDKTTAYGAGTRVPLMLGGDFIVVGRLASGQNVAAGTLLVADANGCLKAASAMTIATGATQVTSSSANGAIVSGSIPGEGRIVAKAMEAVNATSADADIMVLSFV